MGRTSAAAGMAPILGLAGQRQRQREVAAIRQFPKLAEVRELIWSPRRVHEGQRAAVAGIKRLVNHRPQWCDAGSARDKQKRSRWRQIRQSEVSDRTLHADGRTPLEILHD